MDSACLVIKCKLFLQIVKHPAGKKHGFHIITQNRNKNFLQKFNDMLS